MRGYCTVEAAEAPGESYREQAARLWRERCLDIVNTGKSNQYAAVEYLGGTQRYLAVAGLPDCWDQFVDQMRANHSRKACFIREFEKVITEVTPDTEPSLLEKAHPPGSAGLVSRRAERGVPGHRHPGSWWNAR